MNATQKRYYEWRDLGLIGAPDKILNLDVSITAHRLRASLEGYSTALLFDKPHSPELYFNLEVMYMLAVRTLEKRHEHWTI